MSFLTVGGDGSQRPTFFELIAADRLMPSLKAAIVFSLSVFAQRRPILHKILDWEDELFALITAFLDRQSLASSSSTFADSLYGLRRAPYVREGPSKSLTEQQQKVTLLLLVVVPYLRSKLDALYKRHHRPSEGFLGLSAPQQAPRRAPLFRTQGSRSSRLQEAVARMREAALAAFLKAYPFIHMAQEGLTFSYQLAYLLQSSPYFSPTLHLLGQHVVRTSAQELDSTKIMVQGEVQVLSERSKRQERRQQLLGVRSQGNFLWRALHEGLLRANYLFTDHTRNALILAVFGFRLLEWWYTSAEEKLAAEQKLEPPPPPPPPLPSPEGVPLPSDPSICPLCRQTRTNPAMTSVSGYTFCYPCLFNHVTQEQCCPVTRIPASIDSIRRLYQST